MSAKRPTDPQIPVSGLRQTSPTPFLLEPPAQQRDELAKALEAVSVKKLRFEGQIIPQGRDGWRLQGKLGATVVQSCIVSLEPVTTRIDTEVTRSFVPAHRIDQPEPGSEFELTEDVDDDVEPLGEIIDLEAVMAESLSLALPAYPRSDGATLESAQFAADGTAPLRDEDLRPFAGLAALREKMQKDGGES